MATIADICRDAAEEIGVVAAGETLHANDAAALLRRLNRILDLWNAIQPTSVAQQFVTYTLVPSTSPTTIGPSGATWALSQRPVSIESAQLVIAGTPDSYQPIMLRDAQWWAAQQLPTLSDGYPTDLYYEPAWPNGRLYFWPVPSAARSVQLQIRRVLAQVVLTDTFDMAPGYREALTLTLAEKAAGLFLKPVPEGLSREASLARAQIFANNVVTPKLITRDAGMPAQGDSATFPTFNYLIGS
jgi:hypothetical protein